MANVSPKDKFVVIGGQYTHVLYGCVPTLLGAKRLANKSAEYWDNWQGWHIPYVYAIDDVIFTPAEDYDPSDMYSVYATPKDGASPLYGGVKED